MQYADRFKTDPWAVWTQVPIWFVEAALRAVPILRASESMRRAEETAVGAGQLKKGASQRIIRGWQREARGGTSTPRTKKGFERMMMGMGVAGRAA